MMFGTWKIVSIGWWTKSSNLYMGNGWKSPFPSTFNWLFGVPGWYVFLCFCWSMVSSNKNLRVCTLTSWSQQCVSLRLTLILSWIWENKIRTAQAPPKKNMQAIWKFFTFFGQRIHPSFSACRSFFFGAANGSCGGLLGGGHGILRRASSGLGFRVFVKQGVGSNKKNMRHPCQGGCFY